MVIVDRERCGYCGSCVRLCPVDAIRLAETRLQIDERCTECGLCLDSCPVGAIYYADQKPAAVRSPRRRYDVVVVGAGPAGTTTALLLAGQGLSVLCLEKRQEIGSPVRCAEGVGCEALQQFLAPEATWISSTVTTAH
jgi:ferredoxin